MEEQKDILTIRETAEWLGVSESHLRNCIRRGELPGVLRLGQRILISRAAVQRAIEEGKNGGES